ncbi:MULTISPECIES: bifunctional [glutamate--ammonia ligase]-adenylyl-L-tyrosine phosphorylase/[glutamate--ammonia-ligase] adenylyltransferase [Pseudomonas]|jgi:glutamate-ammonia-ligase adenylyltransferase|uniref:bifunctional [glutamate--ammonia ligase]-adenylyl-L-tyrosine phosphorylase/[glutamate--ammonia-ligase] adenylyltransferase n=1 Tax=Pseudomonas TaxID=286 RepID=UPI0009822F07|nr:MULTISPECIES: bifunctional [glutamate--ammonia ligase]-adenylyl-L-tyrosine phosphorylase/[glutamate--ammonia-ligase] adenylyltransferase [Pseudomonas]MCK8656194.1 bifunctional [glutamate--ammonia ligase]-adenylyl-L-tyrosine phosphorylase/[glutamate--ammonia-ligase] adenylyltransferase [Pseudomonas umsongensis]NBB59006.1 bifunctional [glutamate--ammonia ligase]-adenylyl-L-tyrosine phosphorylase/[glutamate--ammonia-ligase] adenylyltransferase [Pseudomonas sp. ODNR1LW]OMQ33769.1 bifunctional glu
MSLPPLADLPAILLPFVTRAEQSFRTAVSALDDDHGLSAWPPERWAQFARVTAASDFVTEQSVRDPLLLLALVQSGELDRSFAPGEMRAQIGAAVDAAETDDQLARALRRQRARHQVRIIWRDLTRQADLVQTCRDLSDMADASIDLAYQWLYARHCQQFGVPTGRRSGEPQQMVVLGMGKLGAVELNLSSDIDLIFAYPEGGETVGVKRPLDNQEFFIRLGQRLIKALDPMTVDGFVFRVDMRLRPYGSSGALVLSFNALEQYYQDQGRDWERYAMIKSRVVAGDQVAGAQLQEMLRPFVYRRYLDFSAIEALRTMKQLIQQEVRRKGMADNIKLGSGGIREVEFIAQAFQLIHGGRDLSLQQRPLLKVLSTLEGQGYLPPAVINELREGYEFLRYTEHAIQAIADRQTQMLPDGAQDQARIAFMLGFADWSAFHEQLMYWRGRVAWHFGQVIADPDEEQGAESEVVVGGEWLPLWEEAQDEEAACRQLQEGGFADASKALKALASLRGSPQLRAMQRLGRERLDAFIPRLLAQAVEHANPDLVLERVLPLVEAVARRSAYLVLLTENPGALRRLLTLCAASPWIAEQITRFPLLLDELLNEGRLFKPPLAPELAAELRERLTRIPEDDLEQQMEALRHFKLAHRLRVAASEIAGSLPLMKVSDYLTWLAEAILEQVLALAWRQTVAKYGTPLRTDGTLCDPGFIIVGYGKVGGLELGHGSDLDLVFIHDGDPQAETDGPKSIDGAQFFTRLGQRIIHLLTAQTNSGQLYEVDMRLRPSGASGLLVSSLGAFARYQENEAWTWEHQALVRARVLVGSEDVGRAFEQVRASILGKARDLPTLRQEVSEMRAKMRDNLGSKSTAAGTGANAFEVSAPFDLKQDAGGIVDIEFMVQYAALAWSETHPPLLRWTDNIRILEELEKAGLMPVEDASLLREAYKSYRSAAHRQALQKDAGVIPGDQFADERRQVMRIWRELGLS